MTYSELQYEKLLDSIFPIVAEKGPSRTTMDLVASKLGMSKRTLYEIFTSKDDMLARVLERLHAVYSSKINDILSKADNVMAGLAGVLLFHQEMMNDMNVNFFRDMDTRYSHLRPAYDHKSKGWTDYMENAINLGIRQGVFRKDTNPTIMIRLLRIQMESLKRMEEFFPKEITPLDIYRQITRAFLRSIATEKGNQILDDMYQ